VTYRKRTRHKGDRSATWWINRRQLCDGAFGSQSTQRGRKNSQS